MSTADFFKGKKVMVTGGVGSVGREVVKQLLAFDVALVRVIDNNESALFDMGQEYQADPRAEFYHCDICDEREMMRTFSSINYCFHAAALKHVPSCERSPFSTVNVNIIGAEVVIRAALANKVEKVLFTSSDKAVNPTNVMGTSKLMGERVFTAMNFLKAQDHQTIFASTRFGNVAGSRGSVIPLFCDQIRRGGPVTLTDDRMTRFIMSVSEAAQLVVESMTFAKGGEVFITKMPVLSIVDLARALITKVAPLYGYDPNTMKIEIVGSRPGEKLWEELSTDEESRRILEGDRYLVVLPATATAEMRKEYQYGSLRMEESSVIYHSDREAKMTYGEIYDFLLKPDVLPADIRSALLKNRTGESLAA